MRKTVYRLRSQKLGEVEISAEVPGSLAPEPCFNQAVPLPLHPSLHTLAGFTCGHIPSHCLTCSSPASGVAGMGRLGLPTLHVRSPRLREGTWYTRGCTAGSLHSVLGRRQSPRAMTGVEGGVCQGLQRQLEWEGTLQGMACPRWRTRLISPLHPPPGIRATLGIRNSPGLAGPGQAIGIVGAAGADSNKAD